MCSDEYASVKSFWLDEEVFKKDLRFFTAIPHPFGSDRQREISAYVVDRLSAVGIESWTDSFSATVPVDLQDAGHSTLGIAKTVEGANIMGFVSAKPTSLSKCLYILGSHYDTKTVPGIEYVGANDSGSSSVLLMQLLSFLKTKPLDCAVLGIWFDGEEAVLWGWEDGLNKHPLRQIDNTYGSRHFVNNRIEDCDQSSCWKSRTSELYKVNAFVLLDMVGSKNLNISLDSNSDETLRRHLVESAKNLGYSSMISSNPTPISDDHIPFIERGIPSLDIIDFNNTDFWHAPGDVFEQVSPASLEVAGRLTLQILLRIQQN